MERENTIFDILEEFRDKELDFILIGGYAVSAFNHRFSVDADIVIKEEDKEDFEKILKEKGFEEVQKKRINSLYRGLFMSYEKKKENLPVNVDLLVNSVECRQTRASWSYEYIDKNSIKANIEGSEKSIKAKVPQKELLIAFKLHSARLTDSRDVLALMENVEVSKITKHIDRGDKEELNKSLEKVLDTVTSEEFKNSYKGVFSEKKLPEGTLNKLKELLREEIDGKT